MEERSVFKEKNFTANLLQALIDDDDDKVDDLLRRSDVKTWINNRVKLNELKSHNITQEGLKCGEQVDEIEEFETVLGYVCTYKSRECLAKVLKAGADVCVRSAYGNTCLHRICLSKEQSYEKYEFLSYNLSTEVFKTLTTTKNSHNYQPIHYAAFSGMEKVLEHLIKVQKCDVNVTGRYKRTALHCAVVSGHLQCVKLLIECDANIELKDEHQNRALHIASFCGYTKCVELLLNSKAETEARGAN